MEQSYENSLKRLEEIIAILEEGGQSLEKNLELFSEGTALISACGKYLDEAEFKIAKLLDDGDRNE